jgi:hypothetical protein
VCRNCAIQCGNCPANNFYLSGEVSTCVVCDTSTCEAHSRNCESCQHSMCREHAETCHLCGGSMCSNCSDASVCQTCRGLARTEPRVLDGVPLPRPAQTWAVVSALTDRPDKSVRLHILYYEEFNSFWQFLRAFGPRPTPVLSVFEIREGSVELVRSVAVEREPLPISPYSPGSYLQARFRKARS